MRWLSQATVRVAAKKSKKAAVASCKKHWKQNYTATEEEVKVYIKQKIKTGIFKGSNCSPVDAGLCALCERYDDNCKNCPLGPTQCCREYGKARDSFLKWKKRKTKFNFEIWEAKAKLMYEELCSLYIGDKQ